MRGGPGRGIGGGPRGSGGRGRRAGAVGDLGAGGWLPPSRLVLPSVLLIVAEKGETHGYELASELQDLNPEANIEPGAVYRGLRRLEDNGYIDSRWDTEGAGPARRLYSLTDKGKQLLVGYGHAIEHRIEILQGLLDRLRQAQGK